ncbi:MAG: GNAT family N-acetyltransferase [Deltaproteobacteria bacterium]|nr:GNAT family N-acetyltransferase [Deltaproteobacteria bacterium]
MTKRTNTKLRVRTATLADAERIAAFQQAMALETEGKMLDAVTLRQGIAAVFDAPEKGFYLVAVADTEGGAAPVVASLLITYEWSDWRNATFWWIQSVYVDAGWRRRGVYRAMYGHVLSLADTGGDVCGIRLYVERTNAVAQRTYDSLGMHKSHYDLYEIDFT